MIRAAIDEDSDRVCCESERALNNGLGISGPLVSIASLQNWKGTTGKTGIECRDCLMASLSLKKLMANATVCIICCDMAHCMATTMNIFFDTEIVDVLIFATTHWQFEFRFPCSPFRISFRLSSFIGWRHQRCRH